MFNWLFRHRLSKNQIKTIEQSIKEFEKKTSAEICVYIFTKSKLKSTDNKEIYQLAEDIFAKKKLYQTKERNAILIYINMADKQSAIVADYALHDLIGNEVCHKVNQQIIAAAKQKKLIDGICNAIESLARICKEHFPIQSDDINELPDKVMIDE